MTAISYTGKSQGTEPCPPDSQLRKIYSAALQSRAKDTVINKLEERISGFEQAINDMKLKDSIRIDFYKRDSVFTAHQKALLLDNVAKLNKSLRWQKLKGKLVGGGFTVAIGYILFQSLKR